MKRILITKAGWLVLATVLASLTLLIGVARAVPTIAWMGNNTPSAISADGSVAVGNTQDGTFETFRWTELTGVVRLGMHTLGTGGGGGSPDVSDDGNYISATIITADSLYATQGIWVKDIGWHRAMPPIPPDGGLISNSYGSCWGLSGDGTTLTGFFWRPGATDGSAHANTWSIVDSTFTHLPTPVQNCRGNDLNYDGSVVVGWSANSVGTWQPTVWENGGVEVLSPSATLSEANGVSNDGNTIWGMHHNPASGIREATIWRRSADGWQEHILGALPGTFPGYGKAICSDMTEASNMFVGYNAFDWYSSTGFVWTLNDGMVSAADFFVANGVDFPPNFHIANLTGVSNDGRVICGFGDYQSNPGFYEGFVVTLDYSSLVSESIAAQGMAFQPNFPNPFNPTTTIALSLDRAQNVRLDIFDARGRLVRVLHDGALAAGRNELQWDGRDYRDLQAASGVYFSRACTDQGETRSQRMMLVK